MKKIVLTSFVLLGLATAGLAQVFKEISAPISETFSTTYSIGVVSKYLQDGNGNGNTDYIRIYKYDSIGRQIYSGYDGDANGTPENISRSFYNAAGQIERAEIDRNNNGTADGVNTYTYNSSKQIIKYEEDNNNDGTPNFRKTTSYNSAGLIDQEDTDQGADGSMEFTKKWQYNAAGLITLYQAHENTTTLVERRTNTWNTNGKLTKLTLEYQGQPKRIHEYTYDANGNRLTDMDDQDGNGTVEVKTEWTYNTANQITSKTVTDAPTSITLNKQEYTYTNGALQVKKYYKRVSNQLTFSHYDTLEYSNDNLLLKTTSKDASTGSVNSTSTWTYNTKGLETSYKHTNAHESRENRNSTIEYDINGNPTLTKNYEYFGKNYHTYEYDNFLKCPLAGNGLSHQFKVTIPSSGDWKFSLCGKTKGHNFTLSSISFCDDNMVNQSSGCNTGSNAEYEAKALAAGEYYLTVAAKTTADSGGYDLNITKTGGSNNIKTQNAKQLKIYPNPTHSKLTIDNQDKMIRSITVLNLMGAKVMEIKQNEGIVDVSSLNNGVYILQVHYENSIGFSRFVKN